MNTKRTVIGVFDSGFGGLTVLRELAKLIPNADYIYFGDTARLPYGSKSAETVGRYALGACNYLESQGAEFLVIACNTATALAMDVVEAKAHVPAIGVVEPGAEAASAHSKTGNVVVIGTEATVASHAYFRALEHRGIRAHEKACPLFVPLVEEGWTDHPVTQQVAQIYLENIFQAQEGARDVLLLGCTHYPLIQPMLRRIVPPEVAIVDSAESTARAVARKLKVEQKEAAAAGKSSGMRGGATATLDIPGFEFYVTDSVHKFRRLGPGFLGYPVDKVNLVDLGG